MPFNTITKALAVILVLHGLAPAQTSFPKPDFILSDAKHKIPEGYRPATATFRVTASGAFARVEPTLTEINALRFSRDGRYLVAGKDFGRVAIWDVAARSFLRAIDTDQGSVQIVSISPDGKKLATVGQGPPIIKLWSFPDGKKLNSFIISAQVIERVIFGPESDALIVWGNTGTSVIGLSSGNHVIDLADDRMPVLSRDGSLMLTSSKSNLVLRDTHTWEQQKTLAKLTPYVWPIWLGPELDTYIYGDATDEHSFVAVHLGDGQMYPNPRTTDVPRYKNAPDQFLAVRPGSSLVTGNTGGRLWTWDFKTGETCLSPALNSNGGAISFDGAMVAAGIDNADSGSSDVSSGVGVWKMDGVSKACGTK